MECSNCLQCYPGTQESRHDPFPSNVEQRTGTAAGLRNNGQAAIDITIPLPHIRSPAPSPQGQSSTAIAASRVLFSSSPEPQTINYASNAQPRTPLPVTAAEIQTQNAKRPYNPQPNRIGAPQTYAMNRFLDEISDFCSLALMPDEQRAKERNKRHRAGLETRLRRLDLMIGV